MLCLKVEGEKGGARGPFCGAFAQTHGQNGIQHRGSSHLAQVMRGLFPSAKLTDAECRSGEAAAVEGDAAFLASSSWPVGATFVPSITDGAKGGGGGGWGDPRAEEGEHDKKHTHTLIHVLARLSEVQLRTGHSILEVFEQTGQDEQTRTGGIVSSVAHAHFKCVFRTGMYSRYCNGTVKLEYRGRV